MTVKTGGGRPSVYKTQDGKRVPGVTTILGRFKDSGGLIHWAWEQGRDGKDYRATRDAAAEAGNIAHQWIDDDIHERPQTRLDADPETLWKAGQALEAFRDWRSMVKFEVVETETPLISELYRFGGTFDALARVNRRLVLLDWKTSNRIYPEYLVQLSAYRQLLKERGGEVPDSAYLLRVGKEFADFHTHSWPEPVLDHGWQAFARMRELYDIDAILKKVA